jgi:hypothetical protein
MKPSHSQHEAFLSQESLPGVSFKLNQAVRVMAGEAMGGVGVVISIEALGVDPEYLVELAGGSDVRVRQSHLESADY